MMSKIVAFTFCISFYLLILIISPMAGQAILNDQVSATDVVHADSSSMFSIMGQLFSGGFQNAHLGRLSIILWLFHLLMVFILVSIVRGD